MHSVTDAQYICCYVRAENCHCLLQHESWEDLQTPSLNLSRNSLKFLKAPPLSLTNDNVLSWYESNLSSLQESCHSPSALVSAKNVNNQYKLNRARLIIFTHTISYLGLKFILTKKKKKHQPANGKSRFCEDEFIT